MTDGGIPKYFTTAKRSRSVISDDDDDDVTVKKVLILDTIDEDTSSAPEFVKNAYIKRRLIHHNSNVHKDESGDVSKADSDSEVSNNVNVKRDSVVRKLTFSKTRTTSRKQSSKTSTSTSQSKKCSNQRDILTLLSELRKKEVAASTKTEPQTATATATTSKKTESSKEHVQYEELALAAEKLNKRYEERKDLLRLEKLRGDIDEAAFSGDDIYSLKPELKPFKSIKFDIPSSPQKPTTPEKRYLSPKKLPTTVKRNLNALIQLTPTKDDLNELSTNRILPGLLPDKLLTPEKTSLELPLHYRILLEIFRTCDDAMSMLHYRKDTATFEKVQKIVERAIRRQFTMRHLEQIAWIYPEAYTFKLDLFRDYGAPLHEKKYHLLITANFEGDTLLPSVLVERRTVFYDRLVKQVKKYHKEFLLSLDPPIEVDDLKLTTWHGQFNLQAVPDIETKELPKPPEKKTVTAREVLEQTKPLFSKISSLNTKSLIENLNKINQECGSSLNQPQKQTELEKNILSKLPKGFLEKLRAKQNEKAIEKMFRNPEHEREVNQYIRLPQIARLTRTVFIDKRKRKLPMSELVAVLMFRYRDKISEQEMQDHLKLLPSNVPQWISFSNYRNVTYVDMDPKIDMTDVLNKLHAALEAKKKLYHIS